jgi:hypothetical protein
MKKEAALLKTKSIHSLILSIELFNRPSDSGRIHGVLILLDHAFEMLFKSIILHKGGKIRVARANQTIGFDAAVRKGLSDGKVKFLTENQALTVQVINSLRDAAQHHILDISEQHLYIQTQAGLTLFREVYESEFNERLYDNLPRRVLPLSTTPPTDLATLFDNESKEVKKLLSPGTRKRTEAEAKLRALSIVDRSLNGVKTQPSAHELRSISRDISSSNRTWQEVFPCVAAVKLTHNGHGPAIELRITKTGLPVTLVNQADSDSSVVAIKRVDELGFYCLSRDQLAQAVNLTPSKTTAAIRYLDLKSDKECYKQITIGKSNFDRYSSKAKDKIVDALKKVSAEFIWATSGFRRRT